LKLSKFALYVNVRLNNEKQDFTMPNPKVGPPTPPAFFEQLPKAIVRAIDVSEALRDAMTSMNALTKYGPVIALRTINSYFDAAKLQQRRIERARLSIQKSFSHGTSVRRGKNLFYDVHFYLISWARIAKLARFIAQTTRFSRTGLVLRRYATDLKDRIDARDHLEHFEDRLPGGKEQHKLAVPNDLLNMLNQYLTYGGRKLDIGTDSIRLLKTIHEEFLLATLYDSLEELATTNRSRLSDLFNAAASKVHVARTTRKVKRMLKGKT
jgi:hypothetical protein